jgi:hypothetical protein
MGRVTTTAGDPGAGDWAAVAGRGPDAGCAVDADFMDPDPGCAGAAPVFECGAAGIPRCVGLDAAGTIFCVCVFGCEAPPPRPSFGGRCIDGPSSAVVVDAASVSPLGPPEKSLEKTLIAEHQR